MPGKRGKSKWAPYKFQTGNAERGRGAGWGQKQILRKAKHKSDKKRDVYGEKWDDSMCFCLFTHDCITCALTAWSLIHIFKSSFSYTLTWIQVVENVLNWLIRVDKDHLALVKPSVGTVHPLKRELPSLRWELLLYVLIARSKIKVTD